MRMWTVRPDWAIFQNLGNKFSFKTSPNVGDFLGNLGRKPSLLSKTAVAIFGWTFEKIGQLFIPTSGHTGWELHDSLLDSTGPMHRHIHGKASNCLQQTWYFLQ